MSEEAVERRRAKVVPNVMELKFRKPVRKLLVHMIDPQSSHPSKEKERLTESLRGPPEAALASPSPTQPIPGLQIRFLPRRAEGITRTGLSHHPSRSGPQSARTTKHWLTSLLGIELPMPESDPTMLEVPNSQGAAFSMVGARRGTKGP